MVETAPSAPPGIWHPDSAQVVGGDARRKALIVIVGKAGAGKSHLIKQLAEDPGFGPDEVSVLMAEDSTSTYDAPVHVIRIGSLFEAHREADKFVQAGRLGRRLPKIVALDSLSGVLDYQRTYYDQNPIISPTKGTRDKLAEYGEIGNEVISLMLKLRDQVMTDVIVMVTTFEGAFNAAPELALDGKVAPKNITRLSSVTLHLRTEMVKYDLQQFPQGPPKAKHRTVGYDPDSGRLDGTCVQRFFITQDAGEVMAKGHHNLALREKAILPDVLRKIHGIAAPPQVH